MASRRIIARFVLFSSLLLVIVACSSTSYTQSVSTHSTSLQAKASTPATLQALQQRSLHLPVVAPGTSCPTSPEKRVNPRLAVVQGNGPAYATIGTNEIMSPAVLFYADAQHWANGADTQGWGGAKVLWAVKPSYQGLVLVRGHQVNGPHELRFDTSSSQPLMHQFVIDTSLGGSPWPVGLGNTRLQAPGCYAYQVDGTTFSYVIVFQAAVQH